MNAPISSPPDKEHESLRRAQRAHESSMDEILASIRSIIAEDRGPLAANSSGAKVVGSAGPQIVYCNDFPAPSRAAATPTEMPVAAPPAEIVSLVSRTMREPSSTPVVSSADEARTDPSDEEPVASPITEATVAASLDALAASVVLQNDKLIEGLAREMLRPILKTWFDDHLPALVERLVRNEIQRVARRGA